MLLACKTHTNNYAKSKKKPYLVTHLNFTKLYGDIFFLDASVYPWSLLLENYLELTKA